MCYSARGSTCWLSLSQLRVQHCTCVSHHVTWVDSRRHRVLFGIAQVSKYLLSFRHGCISHSVSYYTSDSGLDKYNKAGFVRSPKLWSSYNWVLQKTEIMIMNLIMIVNLKTGYQGLSGIFGMPNFCSIVSMIAPKNNYSTIQGL